MNLSNSHPPPINNACVPDIYNRLDAEVIEKTRVINNQLNMRLIVKQKIIAKYRLEAERLRRKEKSLVEKDLSRITQKLPAVACIRDFDEKFFCREPRPDFLPRPKRKKRHFQLAKHDNPICQRCFTNQIPSRKKLHQKEARPSQLLSLGSNRTTESRQISRTSNKLRRHSNKHEPSFIADLVDHEEPDIPQSQNTTKNHTTMLIPAANTFKFLERDAYGRERDLNENLTTPRLMPNEIWKNVVKNLCNQCLKEQRKTRSPNLKNRRLSRTLTRETLFEWKIGDKIRKPSIATENRYPGDGQPHHENSSRRRTSFAVVESPNQPGPSSYPSTKLSQSDTRSSMLKISSVSKTDDLCRSPGTEK